MDDQAGCLASNQREKAHRVQSHTEPALRAITRISTACSWLKIDRPQAVSFA
jgi:hypothetical protein